MTCVKCVPVKTAAAHSVVFALLALSAGPAKAGFITVSYASTVSDSNVADAARALGQPDAITVDGYFDSPGPRTATFGGFGAGDNVSYDSAALASLLGVSESLLANADFISTEHNGSAGLTYEGGSFFFTDGVSSLTVDRAFGDPPSGAVIALGNISTTAYAGFFGTPVRPDGDWVYILIDIDGFSGVDPFVAGFRATLTANRGPLTDTPDPDVMGRIGVAPATAVPSPPSAVLLLIGSIGAWAVRRTRRPAI